MPVHRLVGTPELLVGDGPSLTAVAFHHPVTGLGDGPALHGPQHMRFADLPGAARARPEPLLATESAGGWRGTRCRGRSARHRNHRRTRQSPASPASSSPDPAGPGPAGVQPLRLDGADPLEPGRPGRSARRHDRHEADVFELRQLRSQVFNLTRTLISGQRGPRDHPAVDQSGAVPGGPAGRTASACGPAGRQPPPEPPRVLGTRDGFQILVVQLNEAARCEQNGRAPTGGRGPPPRP